ncbi:MAG: hypothetical protein H7X95_00500 [Deltaproteobacteria bacterium]|nr:hypothetical protein [Deltaproteobacteria bacterium]
MTEAAAIKETTGAETAAKVAVAGEGGSIAAAATREAGTTAAVGTMTVEVWIDQD